MAELSDQDVKDMRDSFKLLARVDRGLEDHIKWSEKMSERRNDEYKDLNNRLKPVEETVGDARKALKALAWIGGGMGLLGGGGTVAFWDHVKNVLKQILGASQ